MRSPKNSWSSWEPPWPAPRWSNDATSATEATHAEISLDNGGDQPLADFRP